MPAFIETLKERNEALFYFGLISFLLSVIFLGLRFFTTTEVMHVNAWIKPFKFALSIALYAWTMAWYCAYLRDFNTGLFSYTVIILLGFEIIYIAVQAARGQLSHFNLSTPVYATLYSLMAIAATLVTIYTAYIGILFIKQDFPELPVYYVCSIIAGIFIFVVFSFEGFVMGSRLSHTIGGPDGSPGIPLLNWSKTFGDPRVAHFIGMHALQVIPLISFYLLKSSKLTIVLAGLYALLAVYTLVQALQGKPFIKN